MTAAPSPAPTGPRLIRLHPQDNVAVVGNEGGLPAGTVLAGAHSALPGADVVLVDKVPQAHKVALETIPAGGAVRRYGVVIGTALAEIPAGRWVYEKLLAIPDARALQGLPMATVAAPAVDAALVQRLKARSFMGYRNADGSVGTRNLLAISTTVQCVSGVVAQAVARIRAELLPKYPNVDGVIGLEHAYGCGVAIDAPEAPIPIRTLRHISLNPNFGNEVLVVSLGCEKLQPERLLPPGSFAITDGRAADAAADNVCLQDAQHVGYVAMLDHILRQAEPKLARLNARQRQPIPISELVVGVQCGGSDALSGVTANPAVGRFADLLVAVGGTVMFSENTEVRDAVEQLTARSATPEVAQQVIDQLGWYDRYLARGQADRSANTTPGNRAGGLSNIVEKAMGSVIKSGSRAIQHVLAPGDKLRSDQRGLVFAATPASDFICGTLQLAAGMNLHIFTTGRGTPYGLAECPVVKVATRSELARRWHDLMDFNAGRIADGELTIDQAGEELLELLIRVASGEHTWAEQHRLHNSLVLFNPAPIT